MTNQPAPAGNHRVSSGHILSGAGWLDAHFEAARPEYEAMLEAVPLEPGWRVLDAGCGSGSYLPRLAARIGPRGQLHAIDIAPENVAAVRQRATEEALHPAVASLTALPYADAAFDALWCANVLQFFSDADMHAVLAEFRRVVRPGGIIAVKDVDMQLWRIEPADPLLISHLSEVSLRHNPNDHQSRGSLRGRTLRRCLERAGLVEVHQRTTMIERWAPLSPVERHFWADWLSFLAAAALQRGVPEPDQAIWRTLLDPNAPDHLVDHPEFYASEGQIVAYGRVPPR